MKKLSYWKLLLTLGFCISSISSLAAESFQISPGPGKGVSPPVPIGHINPQKWHDVHLVVIGACERNGGYFKRIVSASRRDYLVPETNNRRWDLVVECSKNYNRGDNVLAPPAKPAGERFELQVLKNLNSFQKYRNIARQASRHCRSNDGTYSQKRYLYHYVEGVRAVSSQIDLYTVRSVCNNNTALPAIKQTNVPTCPMPNGAGKLSPTGYCEAISCSSGYKEVNDNCVPASAIVIPVSMNIVKRQNGSGNEHLTDEYFRKVFREMSLKSLNTLAFEMVAKNEILDDNLFRTTNSINLLETFRNRCKMTGALNILLTQAVDYGRAYQVNNTSNPYFVASAGSNQGPLTIGGFFLHEAMHQMGYGHNDDSSHVMYNRGVSSTANVSQQDVNRLKGWGASLTSRAPESCSITPSTNYNFSLYQ